MKDKESRNIFLFMMRLSKCVISLRYHLAKDEVAGQIPEEVTSMKIEINA